MNAEGQIFNLLNAVAALFKLIMKHFFIFMSDIGKLFLIVSFLKLYILAVLCLLAAVFFLLPLSIGILHFGMVWPAALLLLCAAWLTWPDFFRRLLRPKCQ